MIVSAKEYFEKCLKDLTLYDDQEKKSILFLIFEEVLKLNKIDIITNREITSSRYCLKKIELVIHSLNSGLPIQYILRHTHFCGLKIKTYSGVLIPRPETEELVYLIANENGSKTKLQVFDIGCGSGAIAIALEKMLPQSSVIACDIDPLAVTATINNAKNCNSKICVKEIDILNFEKDRHMRSLPMFDILVSNPPYVMMSEKAQMHKNVLEHEPHSAIFVPDDSPLIYYEAIAKFARLKLKEGGSIYFEINPLCHQMFKQLKDRYGFCTLKFYDDINNKIRFVKLIK